MPPSRLCLVNQQCEHPETEPLAVHPSPPAPFGTWLRNSSAAFQPIDLAKRLGISGSSQPDRTRRKQFGEDGKRLASSWGLDPVNLKLRAGLLQGNDG